MRSSESVLSARFTEGKTDLKASKILEWIKFHNRELAQVHYKVFDYVEKSLLAHLRLEYGFGSCHWFESHVGEFGKLAIFPCHSAVGETSGEQRFHQENRRMPVAYSLWSSFISESAWSILFPSGCPATFIECFGSVAEWFSYSLASEDEF